MACGSCGKNKTYKYRWTGSSGQVVWYDTEILAKAAVVNNGGSYKKVAV